MQHPNLARGPVAPTGGVTRSVWLKPELDRKLEELMVRWGCKRPAAMRNAIRIVYDLPGADGGLTHPPRLAVAPLLEDLPGTRGPRLLSQLRGGPHLPL